jgi:hypothetical protein
MSSIGPNARLRVKGQEAHDMGSVNWELNKEKTPYIPIGQDEYDTMTTGPAAYTWNGEIQTNSSGDTAIDYNDWCLNDGEYPLIATNGTRTVRLFDACVDTVGEAIEREAGTWTLSVSGKCKSIVKD